LFQMQQVIPQVPVLMLMAVICSFSMNKIKHEILNKVSISKK